ncbi:MAG: asparagine--tRNA ligase [Planctomycetota bacterium]
MTGTTIARLSEHDGQTATIRGWLYNRRSKGKIQFLLLRDGSGIVQCVALKNELGDDVFERLDGLPYESTVEVEGAVKLDARAPGGVEMKIDRIAVLAEAAPDYPISKQAHGPDHLLSHRHLWLRSKRQAAIMRIRDEIVRAIRDFMHQRDFVNVDAPIFTPNACEGTTNLFEVDYHDETVFLTQSGQLYNEATAAALGRVYCFGPTFRAEKSKTRRHLQEFWMMEPEMAFCTFDEVMDLAEDCLRYVIGRALEHRQRDLADLERDTTILERCTEPFPRITYEQAVALMHEKGHEFEFGDDFGAPDETFISEQFQQPVMIHRYPKAVKAFYMKEDPEDSRFALGVDVIAPEGCGEIIGGGQREESIEVLKRKIEEHGLPEEAFRWYLDLRRWGSFPHGGFGLGLERTVGWVCGLEHVREAIPFPRTLYRMYP